MTEEFIGRGHIVIGCARSSDVLKKLQQRHPKPNSFQRVDVAVQTEVRRWAEAVIKQHGPPDLLINNAAVINRNAPLWQVGAGEFSRVMDVNVKGVANQIRHFAPAMIKRGRGVIVNFSSSWGRSVDAEVAPCCATKFAIEGLTRALALELPAGLARKGLAELRCLRRSHAPTIFPFALCASARGLSLPVPEISNIFGWD